MRSAVVFGDAGAWSGSSGAQQACIDGVSVRCGLVTSAERKFDADAPENAAHVLVRVRAFSCNYRDKGIIHIARAFPRARFSAFGSEFVGEVVAVGSAPCGLAPGDRVLPDHHYIGPSVGGPAADREGVITNQASREYQVHPARKLVRVPDAMPDAVAAAFSLGAQTAYGMVRRLRPAPGSTVLVTSATSNTSLFVLAALRRAGVRAVGATTSPQFAARLTALGADDVVALSRGSAAASRQEALAAVAQRVGGFDAVVDPFFDLHAEHAVRTLKPFGTYVTCGLYGQNPDAAHRAGVTARVDGTALLHDALLRNITLVGNCLGVREDLETALRDYAEGRLEATLDSVFTGGNRVSAYLDRTFSDGDRFGKVVYQFD